MGSLTWLTYSVILTGLMWVPYVLDRMATIGIFGAMQNPTFDEPRHHEWGARAKAAHINAVENLVIFAALVLTAAHMEVADTSMVLLAAQIYFFARLAHYIIYAAGIPVLRTLSFVAGFAAQVMVALQILQAV